MNLVIYIMTLRWQFTSDPLKRRRLKVCTMKISQDMLFRRLLYLLMFQDVFIFKFLHETLFQNNFTMNIATFIDLVLRSLKLSLIQIYLIQNIIFFTYNPHPLCQHIKLKAWSGKLLCACEKLNLFLMSFVPIRVRIPYDIWYV